LRRRRRHVRREAGKLLPDRRFVANLFVENNVRSRAAVFEIDFSVRRAGSSDDTRILSRVGARLLR
jgi:hypothetical protein